jgi:hypothetical protein
MMDFMGIWMLLGLLVVVLGVGLAIYLGVRAGLGPGRGPDGRRFDHDGARAELDRRLAAGDIDVDEYHERASALRSVGYAGRRR